MHERPVRARCSWLTGAIIKKLSQRCQQIVIAALVIAKDRKKYPLAKW